MAVSEAALSQLQESSPSPKQKYLYSYELPRLLGSVEIDELVPQLQTRPGVSLPAVRKYGLANPR
jgi:hypothetical protein